MSGHTAALKLVSEAATAAGALKASMLAVAGAFHTDLMMPASQALTKVRPCDASQVGPHQGEGGGV